MVSTPAMLAPTTAAMLMPVITAATPTQLGAMSPLQVGAPALGLPGQVQQQLGPGLAHCVAGGSAAPKSEVRPRSSCSKHLQRQALASCSCRGCLGMERTAPFAGCAAWTSTCSRHFADQHACYLHRLRRGSRQLHQLWCPSSLSWRCQQRPGGPPHGRQRLTARLGRWRQGRSGQTLTPRSRQRSGGSAGQHRCPHQPAEAPPALPAQLPTMHLASCVSLCST